MVYKYLSPKHVIVKHGLHIDESSIVIKITDVAMMQLIDVPEHLTLADKVCGINRIFVAPEVQSNHGYTTRADIWSTGVILYLLVTGGTENEINAKDQAFQFTEPEW